MARYKVVVDGKEVASWNHIPLCKRDAEFWLDYCNAFSATIYRGKKIVAHKTYDQEKWIRFY